MARQIRIEYAGATYHVMAREKRIRPVKDIPLRERELLGCAAFERHEG